MTMGVLVDNDWTTICRCGVDTVAVESDAVIGSYAVHPTISHGTPVGPGRTVTHRASGFALWHAREFGDALAVAKWLSDNLLLPDNHDGVLQWKQQLTTAERLRLMVALSAIAPREYVVAA